MVFMLLIEQIGGFYIGDFFIKSPIAKTPVNEEAISNEYNSSKNESNILKQEPSPLNYVKNLKKRINDTENEVSRLNELIMQHCDEITKN
uniref:Uncharacterized protein n=1 Tax=Amphimedon queenslandica TaxID=400682 RepID=A0A1X7U778_AMPQE